MATVYLGNHSVLEHGRPVDGEQVTWHITNDGDTPSEIMRTLVHDDGVLARISGDGPVWVASDDQRIAKAVSAHFDCPIIDFIEGQSRFYEADGAG